jgi:hypothetical protein
MSVYGYENISELTNSYSTAIGYSYKFVFRLRAVQLSYIPLLFCTIVNTAWRVLTLWVADRPTDADGYCEYIV